MEQMLKDFKSGYVAIVGQPNVGKSTLTNNLLEFKLSITTPRPQTTRHRILGIHSGDNFQIIFLDTPGIIDPSYLLQKVMMRAANRAIEDADLILLLVETAAKPLQKDIEIIHRLKTSGKPIVLAINKIDLVDARQLLPLMDAFRKLHDFVAIIPISAKKGISTKELEQALLAHLPSGAPFYPPKDITDHPERFFVSEIIREKIFQNYGDEIPYSTAVVIDEFKERRGRKDYLKARIIVERPSQKGIIIGKKGAALKNVGQLARVEIEDFLDRPVYLELWVAVREKWRKKGVFLKEFGYDH